MTDTVLMRQVRRLINALDLEDRMLGGHPRIASAVVKARAILGDLEAVQDDAVHAQAGKHVAIIGGVPVPLSQTAAASTIAEAVQAINPDDHRGASE